MFQFISFSYGFIDLGFSHMNVSRAANGLQQDDNPSMMNNILESLPYFSANDKSATAAGRIMVANRTNTPTGISPIII